ncbi:UNVERIFIED_ORG: acyl-CoA reductase-like NAD-dependent aldehyde dehydrogenase [Rhizobium esperanzae]|nr:aldehyde dehydrogenase domain-containing protein [Rhizobium phaseoli Brasil 5]
MNIVSPITTDTSPDAMKALLARQRASFLKEGPPDIATRIDRIDRVIALLVDHKDAIAAALSEDFGSRSVEASLLLDAKRRRSPAVGANVRKKLRDIY